MRRSMLFLISLTLVVANCGVDSCYGQDTISLAGKWKVALDPDSIYYNNNKLPDEFPYQLHLPGTTDEAGIGKRAIDSEYGILTRRYKHIGPAWYEKFVEIPGSWFNKNIVLYLERVLWESTVFIDGREVSRLSTLYVAHEHFLGKLSPGKHTITICVNNDLVYNIGDKGHGYTEHTQSIWNGIVGRIGLKKLEDIFIDNVKTYPNSGEKGLHLETFIHNTLEKNVSLTIRATLSETVTGKQVKAFKHHYKCDTGRQKISFSLTNLRGLRLWDEYDPVLYTITVEMLHGKSVDRWNDNIGFRQIGTTKNKILVNGNVSYIRGNLDCVHFPLTGYPSCNEKDWERIFQKYKDYGLNTVRFHSWCPPEAAFRAADKMGIYIQAELLWIDQWMETANKERSDMYTKGQPKGLGNNTSSDVFVQNEIKHILDAYGNHPSFLFFCIGNELGNTNFDVAADWIQKAKEEDPRRLYSVSTARKITSADDYMVTHNIPGVGSTYAYNLNRSDNGLEKNYSKVQLPVIAHEVGQVPVYPEWTEIEKYTGVLKAWNLEGFREAAMANGVGNRDKDFHKATGSLQQLLYKNLIENILLAPSSAGFQILSMTDYPGQGEAFVGWLDSFWDDKKTTPPETFRQYCNSVVPLIRTPSFIYRRSDTIQLVVELANYFKTDLQKALYWEFVDKNGSIVSKGLCKQNRFTRGRLTQADTLSIPANIFPVKAGQYAFRVYFSDHSFSNSWDFFIFPDHVNTQNGDVFVTDEWDHKVDSLLTRGEKVLLIANKLGNELTSHAINFTPLVWSSSWFPGQDNETLGSWIDKESIAFNHFPTDDFTNWQWYSVTPGGRYFKLKDVPKDFQPIVQPVSDFHFNEKLGSIFEAKVGAGKLLICGYDLKQVNNLYSDQLLYSIVEYMKSRHFNPLHALSENYLKSLLTKKPLEPRMADLPDEFKRASLFVVASANARHDLPSAWELNGDSIYLQTGYRYIVTGARCVNKENTKGWSGKEISIWLETPKGIRGYLYIQLTNPDNVKGAATINLEGRTVDAYDITGSGKWIKLFLMREDSLDGKIEVSLTTANKEGLLVSRMAIVEDD